MIVLQIMDKLVSARPARGLYSPSSHPKPDCDDESEGAFQQVESEVTIGGIAGRCLFARNINAQSEKQTERASDLAPSALHFPALEELISLPLPDSSAFHLKQLRLHER